MDGEQTSRRSVVPAASAAIASARWRSYLAACLEGVRSDWPCYALVAVYSILASGWLIASGNWHGGEILWTADTYMWLWLQQYGIAFPAALGIIGLAHIVHRLARRRGLGFRVMFGPARVGRLVAGTLLVIGLLPFRTLFNAVKDSIGVGLEGFRFDAALANLDRAIHFGVDPFHWLYAFAKSEWVQRVVEFNYDNLWFLICFGALYWVAVSPRLARIRVRYILCYILIWAVIGNVFALLFSSAGPAYYGLVTGDTARFSELNAFLQATSGSFGAADYQHYLWQLHVANKPGLGSGISAFPSMHVSIIMLNVLFLWECSKKWGRFGFAYVALTVASSVYLGWHYAVDGYTAIILTTAIYFAVKALAAIRWGRPQDTASAPSGLTA
jgi:hypothetical protein